MTVTTSEEQLAIPLQQVRAAMLSLDADQFERLAGELLGNLLNVAVSFARPGSQEGGDASVSGQRDLKLEARRYGDSSRLDRRGILGQIEEALVQEPALEAWILATTKEVPDQIVRSATTKAEKEGIAFLALDWGNAPLPKLAVLAASFPKTTLKRLDRSVEPALSEISADDRAGTIIKRLRAELDSWAIGYSLIRDIAQSQLKEIWSTPNESAAVLNQNVAGGALQDRFLRRVGVHGDLNDWFERKTMDQPAVLVGRDGSGKTWAAVDWIQDRLEVLPIVVVLSSQNLGGPPPTSVFELKSLLACHFYALSGLRDETFWRRRVERLVSRPEEEGALFFIFFDGLNESASNKWVSAFRQFLAEPFSGRVRIIATTRTHFFETRLNRFRSIRPQPKIINVSGYGLEPGGEFEQKLQLEGIARSDLSEDIINLASVPRFFELIIMLKDDIDDLNEITVPKLLWEYGRTQLFDASSETLTHEQWNTFIVTLANNYRDGELWKSPDELASALSSPVITSADVQRRVSLMVNGVCAELISSDQLSYKADFVHFALGLAVLERIKEEPNFEAARSALEVWLDSISGFDERGSVLDAAGCLAAAALDRFSGPGVSAIIAAWVETQNLPDGSVERLSAVSSSLFEPILDAIGLLAGRNSATARYLAINAIEDTRKDDVAAAELIARKGAGWMSDISLERGHSGDDLANEKSLSGRRAKRLQERIGHDEIGYRFTIAGHNFELVESAGSDLHIAATQLLLGRPLQRTGIFFEVVAIHTAITGPSVNQEDDGWLNRLNTIDPKETATALRASSQRLLCADLPSECAPSLIERAAAIVLWKTGYDEDGQAAWEIDPKTDYPIDYEKDYLRKPSQSFIALERRHMEETLLDKEVDLIRRIDRCKPALLDPTFTIPQPFANELVEYTNQFDFSRLDLGRGKTKEDTDWDKLSIALARVDPRSFAEISKQRMQGFGQRSAEYRYGTSKAAIDAYLLVSESERVALEALRNSAREKREGNERGVQNRLLAAEIQGLDAADQYRRIIDAELEVTYTDLADATLVPSKEQVDLLFAGYAGQTRALEQLIVLLAHKRVDLSDAAFDFLLDYALDPENEEAIGPVWPLLSRSGTSRFAAALWERDWSWSDHDNFWASYHGSKALAIGFSNRPFEEIAARIAPAFLLRFLAERSGSRSDSEFIAMLLTRALLQQEVDPEEPTAELIIDAEKVKKGHYDYSIGRASEELEHERDWMYALKATSDPATYNERRNAAVQAATEQVRTARKNGASLHLIQIRPNDFDLIFKHCPEFVETWLDGIKDKSGEAQRRIRLAEGFYLALCRKLLDVSPGKGAELWRLLRTCLFTRFKGVGGVDELIHMVFQAEASPQVLELRDQIYDIEAAPTDEHLVNILIAARAANQEDWLREKVKTDSASNCPAHQLRAAFLEPLIAVPDIAPQADWPIGQALAGKEHANRLSWEAAQHEAYARHWLRVYAGSDDPEDAHAAWVLVEASSDPRAKVWMNEEYHDAKSQDAAFDAQKRVFINARSDELSKAMDGRAKNWKRRFGGRNVGSNLAPWSG